MKLLRTLFIPILRLVLPNCRQVTEMLLLAQDRPPRLRERLLVAVHMPLCAACPRFRQQVRLMKKASQRWRSYSEDEGLD
ncbi:zf-HC2 domain-containing protein [Mitsuaria sp. WAJ17]|uniref:anti-sigma factor family protein n=1 Tax=Mitsuaria sp. WAJ17 TaxID=2761452 RepID=UPI001602E045|nr:zf-HC2 domain-containing protein [Mitsuaria sp. WAJ17]MBB2486414.1 zf-HC2 domain-containing protein [Mitsuaria sp. WAJ17]